MLVKELIEELLKLDQEKRIGSMSMRNSTFKENLEIEFAKVTKENCFAADKSDNECVYWIY